MDNSNCAPRSNCAPVYADKAVKGQTRTLTVSPRRTSVLCALSVSDIAAASSLSSCATRSYTTKRNTHTHTEKKNVISKAHETVRALEQKTFAMRSPCDARTRKAARQQTAQQHSPKIEEYECGCVLSSMRDLGRSGLSKQGRKRSRFTTGGECSPFATHLEILFVLRHAQVFHLARSQSFSRGSDVGFECDHSVGSSGEFALEGLDFDGVGLACNWEPESIAV